MFLWMLGDLFLGCVLLLRMLFCMGVDLGFLELLLLLGCLW